MARTKATLSTGARLADYLSASLLARVYPAELIESILDEHGVNSQRQRSLPALVTAYYCMALSLYPEVAYEEVYAVVAQGLGWMQGQSTSPEIAKSSISAARQKIGVTPLKELHRRACLPLADRKQHPNAFYAGLRLVAIDGSNFEVADEAGNAATFGYPGSRTGHAAYPQAQCAVLIECASHAVLGANLGAYRTAEWTLCEPLIAQMNDTMLCLADRGFNGYAHWKAAAATGAQLLWRCVVNRQLPVVKLLADGSYLSALYPDQKSRRSRRGEIMLRVIEYSLPDLDGQTARYRLVTTLLDPKQAPAMDLATLYHERWEVEGVFDELKIHLRKSRRVLRSKTPDGVRQEFYGWVLAHYAVCWLMQRAGDAHGIARRKLSFTGHVNLMNRAQPRSGAFPPSAPAIAKALVRRSAA
jgi:Insertion element 4 transposase N-terminal/Transposase DDE domain